MRNDSSCTSGIYNTLETYYSISLLSSYIRKSAWSTGRFNIGIPNIKQIYAIYRIHKFNKRRSNVRRSLLLRMLFHLQATDPTVNSLEKLATCRLYNYYTCIALSKRRSKFKRASVTAPTLCRLCSDKRAVRASLVCDDKNSHTKISRSTPTGYVDGPVYITGSVVSLVCIPAIPSPRLIYLRGGVY